MSKLKQILRRYISEADKLNVVSAMDGIKRIAKYGMRIWHQDIKANMPGNISSVYISNAGIGGFGARYKKDFTQHWYRDIDKEIADEANAQQSESQEVVT